MTGLRLTFAVVTNRMETAVMAVQLGDKVHFVSMLQRSLNPVETGVRINYLLNAKPVSIKAGMLIFDWSRLNVLNASSQQQ